MSILEANLDSLGQRVPELRGILAVAESDTRLEAAGQRGTLSAKTAHGWLHSRYDPLTEARRIAEQCAAHGEDCVVCLGMGLGYVAQAVLERGLAVLVVEPDAGWLKRCLEIRPVGELLLNPGFHLALAPDGDSLLGILHQLQPKKVALYELPYLHSSFPERVEAWRDAMQRYQEKDRININTLKRFGRLWVRNSIHNLDALAVWPGINGLIDRFRSLPALVLAAGPSLDELLPHLAELRERCLLIAVDTALRSLLRNGIEPDFVVVVDPQLYNSWHLHRCVAPRSLLVSEVAVWPSVLRGAFRGTLLCQSQYPFGQLIEQRTGLHKGKIGAGGSVATSAWDLARLLGCAPIYMAGLDLSFPGGKTHAAASLFEQRNLAEGRRLNPAATALFKAAQGGQPYHAPANNGELVLTDKRLSLYAWWYTRTTARYPEQPTYNLSNRGLRIEGLSLVTREAIERHPPRRSTIDTELALGYKQALECLPLDRNERLQSALESLRQELQLIAELAARAKRLCTRLSAGKLRDEDGAMVRQALAELDNIDQAVLGNQSRDLVGFLVPDLAEAASKKVDSLEASFRHTAEIYEVIEESVSWHLGLLPRAAGNRDSIE